MKTRKPKPFTAQVSVTNKANPTEKDYREIGTTELTPIDYDDKSAIVAGVIKNSSGRVIGALPYFTIPLEMFPKGKPAGRPKATEKHLAACLAWLIEYGRTGKAGQSDRSVNERFSVGGPSKVRKYRGERFKDVSLQILTPSDFDCGLLIEKPMAYPEPNGETIIVGVASIWTPTMERRVLSGKAVKLTAVISQSEGVKGLLGPITVAGIAGLPQKLMT